MRSLVTLRNFRLFSFVEAVSFIMLLFVAMPLKYLANLPLAVTIVGAAHGWIFVAYVVFVFLTARQLGWKTGPTAGALVASVLPFGPFVFDRLVLRAKTPS